MHSRPTTCSALIRHSFIICLLCSTNNGFAPPCVFSRSSLLTRFPLSNPPPSSNAQNREAEARAQDAEERIKEAERNALEAEQRAQDAYDRAAKAEERAQRAVEATKRQEAAEKEAAVAKGAFRPCCHPSGPSSIRGTKRSVATGAQ